MPTWWKPPGSDGRQIAQREVEDGETGLYRVKEVFQKFQILEDQTVACELQEQEIEEHLAANKLKAQQVRVNVKVARRLQEQEDEGSRELDRRLHKQTKDMERNYKLMLEEELERREMTRQRSHRERKSRARGESGEMARRSEESKDLVTERRDEAFLWHGIGYSHPRSRRPFVARETEEGAAWCEEESGREGDPCRLGNGSEVERERAAIGSGQSQVIRQAATERHRHESPAPCLDRIERTRMVSDPPEDGSPLTSSWNQLKQHRTRPCVTERSQQPARSNRRGAWKLGSPTAGGSSQSRLKGKVDSSEAAPVSGSLATIPPAGFSHRRECDAFQTSTSDSESRLRHRQRRRDAEGVRARAMSEVGHQPVQTRQSHEGFAQQNSRGAIHPETGGYKNKSPGPHPSMADPLSGPRSQPGIARRTVNLHYPLNPKEKLGKNDGWKVENGHHPLAAKEWGNEIHQLLAVKEKQAHRPLAVNQMHVNHPLAVNQKHSHHPLAVDQNLIHPLAVDRKHSHHPLAVDRKHSHHPLAVDRKHSHHPLAVDRKHSHHPLAVDRKHSHHPLAVDRKHSHHSLALDQRQAQSPMAVNQNHADHRLTVEKHVCYPPRTKVKGKQVHFLLAPSECASPTQNRLANKEKQMQLPLDSKGKEVRSSLVGKQKPLQFPLVVGEKEMHVHRPLMVKENDVQCPLASKRKESLAPSPLAVKQNPIQYRLDSKDAEAIIDYVLDKRTERVSSSPKCRFRSASPRRENLLGPNRSDSVEMASDKSRASASRPPDVAQEISSQYAGGRAEGNPSRSRSGRRSRGMNGSVDSPRWSDEARPKATDRPKAADRNEVPGSPRRERRPTRAQDNRSRGRTERRRASHSRPRSPSDQEYQLSADASRDSATGKVRGLRNGLPTSAWCSDGTLKDLQALELWRAQMRKATADENQLQLARDEEFALDLLRQEMMAVSLSAKQKQSSPTQTDQDFPAKESPRSDSLSSVNVDWAEEPRVSKSAYF